MGKILKRKIISGLQKIIPARKFTITKPKNGDPHYHGPMTATPHDLGIGDKTAKELRKLYGRDTW